MDDNAGGLVAIGAALGGDGAVLVGEGLADEEEAGLEDDGGIAEDEVYGAGDGAVGVELAVGLHVERGLVAVHAAVVEGDEVSLHSERHRLVLCWPRRVPESHPFSDEPIPLHSCKMINPCLLRIMFTDVSLMHHAWVIHGTVIRVIF